MDNCTGLFSLQTENDKETVQLTICDKSTKDWQLLLVIAASMIVFFLGMSILSIYTLHRILNPIGMMQMSRKCFPALCFDTIWPEDQKPLLAPILHFVLAPSKDTLEESNEKLSKKLGEDLVDFSIKHGYRQVIKSTLSPSVGHPLSSPLLRKALLEGDVKVIKIILASAKRSEGTIQVDQTKLDAFMNALSRARGKMISKAFMIS